MINSDHISLDKSKHMHAVAQLMFNHYDLFGKPTLTRDEIYLLGYCHDIGCMLPGGHDGHELGGQKLFEDLFYKEIHIFDGKVGTTVLPEGPEPGLVIENEDYCSSHIFTHCIRWHGTTPKEYMSYFGIPDSQIIPELKLLWWADMHVDAHGNLVSFDERLADISGRYGAESTEYNISKDIVAWFMECDNNKKEEN